MASDDSAQFRPVSGQVQEILKTRQFEKAEAFCIDWIAKHGETDEVLCGLGVAYYWLGRHDEAVEVLEKAARMNPKYLAPCQQLSHIYFERGEYEKAIEQFNKLIAIDPNLYEAKVGAAKALINLNNFETSLAIAKELLHKDPENVTYLEIMGNSLSGLKYFWTALKVWRKISLHRPNDLDVVFRIAQALSEIGFVDQAKTMIRRGIDMHLSREEIEWKRVRSFGQMANLINDKEYARKAFNAVMEACPEGNDILRAYVEVNDIKSDDPAAASFHASLEKGNLDQTSKTATHFALADIYHSEKDYDKAFAHYKAANDGRLLETTQDMIDKHFSIIDGIQEAFTPDIFERFAGLGYPSTLPIFITGMPRSGTTLTETILATHPDVAPGGERSDLNDIVFNCTGADGEPIVFPQDILARLTPDLLAGYGRIYERILTSSLPPSPHYTDKMPSNCNLIGMIQLCLPNSVIIFCKRNPVDVCLSCYQAGFALGHEYSYDLRTLGLYYRKVMDLKKYWDDVLPGRIYTLDYQELVENFEESVRRLLEHCGLSWHEDCLNFHQTKRTVMTASSSQVRQPLYTSSVNRWHRYAAYLGPLLEGLGPYAPTEEEIPADILALIKSGPAA